MTHHFKASLEWTGNAGSGTSTYAAYNREHLFSVEGKDPIQLSSAPVFRGDPKRYNPEDMLLYAASSCHMLWFLHVCADAGVIAMEYRDHPEGILTIDTSGIGRFTSITLKPIVVFKAPVDQALLISLHERAHEHCFIANTLNCPVTVDHQC